MTKCKKCKSREAEIKLSFMPHPLCKRCFIRQVEKRVIEQLKRFLKHTQRKQLRIVEDSSVNFACAHHILKKYEAKYRFELYVFPLDKKAEKKEPILELYTLDELAAVLLSGVLFKMNTIDSYMAPLGLVHSKELELYSQLKALKGNKVRLLSREQEAVLKELDKLEIRHTQIKFSVVRFFQRLEDLQEK